MIRKSWLCMLAIFGLLALAGGNAAPARAASGAHFLWKVTSKTNTVYLLGSVHALRESDYPLAEPIQKAFAGSDALVLEIDLDHADPSTVQQAMLAKGVYRHGETLQQSMPATDWKKATELAHSIGLDLDGLQSMKPWLAGLAVLSTELNQAGLSGASGVDMHFAVKAHDANMPVIGLETLDYQVDLFANLDAPTQRSLLLQSLAEAHDFRNQMDQLITTWKQGDIDGLRRLMMQEFKDYPALYAKLISKRNQTWSHKIERMIGGSRNYFIVVGALHLIGPDGVIAHLRADGYTVERQ